MGFIEIFYKNGIKSEDAFDYFNQQVQKYAKSQLNEAWWKHVVDFLNKATPENINEISSEMINKWKDKELLHYSNMQKDTYDYIKPEFLLLTTNCVINILKENKII